MLSEDLESQSIKIKKYTQIRSTKYIYFFVIFGLFA